MGSLKWHFRNAKWYFRDAKWHFRDAKWHLSELKKNFGTFPHAVLRDHLTARVVRG